MRHGRDWDDGRQWTARVAVLAVLVLLGLGLIVAGPAVASEDTTAPDEEADRVHMEVRIADDGDAIWTVEYRIGLEDDADRAAFDSIQADIEDDPTPYTDRYGERMDAAADSAATATGREMAIEAMTVSTATDELPETTGIVRYEFRWTNFAESDGEQFIVGDSLDGMFLDERTSLLIRWPDGWEITEISPEPTDQRSDVAIWRGPFEFSSGEPRVTVSPVDDARWTGTITAIVGGAILVGLLGIIVWLGLRRRSGEATPVGGTVSEEIDSELLSNEEQVIQVIRMNGGRMKQKEVAEALDWTAAKTSQVTTELRDEGRLEGFRLGRENVLKVPDDDSER